MRFPPTDWWPDTMEIVFEHEGAKIGWLFGPKSDDQTRAYEEMKGCPSVWNTLVGMRQAVWELSQAPPHKVNGAGAAHGPREGQ